MDRDSLIGRRIRLIRCTDPYTHLEPGSMGTVTFVDSLGTVHVDWDSGPRLGLSREAGDDFIIMKFRGMEAH